MQSLVKRSVDVIAATLGLVLLSPLLILVTAAIWIAEGRPVFYVAERCGYAGRPFRMVKFRTMIKNADSTGVTSTAEDDARITRTGRLLRATKLDEVPQLLNVLVGDMSLVGPRPNTPGAVDTYDEAEQALLEVRPGISDFASIVFADEGAILHGSRDPDTTYELLIRPGKSELGVFYVRNRNTAIDLQIVLLTAINAISRKKALAGVAALLERSDAPDDLVFLARRIDPLVPKTRSGVSPSTESP